MNDRHHFLLGIGGGLGIGTVLSVNTWYVAAAIALLLVYVEVDRDD